MGMRFGGATNLRKEFLAGLGNRMLLMAADRKSGSFARPFGRKAQLIPIRFQDETNPGCDRSADILVGAQAMKYSSGQECPRSGC